jgi:dynein intermediate chain 2
MNHREGGWPKEVDPSEVIDTNRHRKKIEKDPSNIINAKYL